MNEMELKHFGGFEVKDADKGEVEAIVATLGVVDNDGDVILPGATDPSQKVKLSAYAHDVILANAPPVGIGTITEERDKLIFRGRFFTTTERGREAFETVKELGADGEWSFGFPKRVKLGELTPEWKAKGARRVIVGDLVPIEASPVFRGAGIGTMTTSVKAEGSSLTDRIEAVHNALWRRNDTATVGWWAHEVFDDYVIVRAGETMLRVSYTVDDEGHVTLGEAVEVEVVYQPVAKSEEPEVVEAKEEAPDPEAIEQAAIRSELERLERASATVAAIEAAEEAKRLAGELEAKRARFEEEQAAIKAEFERFERTRRRLGDAA